MPLPAPKMQTERSPADELRQWLTEAEAAIVAMRSGHSAANVITLLDRIDERVQELKMGRIDLRSEETRIESLRRRLLREASRAVSQVRRNGEEAALADSSTWQKVRETADATRRAQTRRYITIGALIGVLAILLFVVLPWVFPPTPTANTADVQRLVNEGNFSEALVRAQAEQQRVPSDPDIWIWLGALYQEQGQQTQADQAWQTARTLTNDLDFHNTRGIVLLQTKKYKEAEGDARELLKHSETQANGYYLLGQAQSAQNQLPEALESFQQAAAIAEQTNNATIVIAAKLEIQNLMQRPAAPPTVPNQ